MKNSCTKTVLGTTATLALLASSLLGTSAVADELPSSAFKDVQALDALHSDNAGVLEDRHNDLETRPGKVVAKTTEIVAQDSPGKARSRMVKKVTTVPLDARSAITIEDTSENVAASISLPFSAKTDEATQLADGTPVFDHENGASTVPVVKSDGSVQITTVIDDKTAPTRYDYETSVLGAASIKEIENGSLAFLDEEGEFLAGIAPAWAKDATGKDVPTRYQVRGMTVVQIVDHDKIADVEYPVIADPWLGVDLFSKTYLGTKNRQLTINARKSAWGQAMHTPGNGQAIFLTAGWSELKNKQPAVKLKKSLHQQYDCHVGGGFFNFAGDWNLEQFRPNRTRHWTYGVAVHRCNWTTPNRY
ncbi:hypothetical protein [Arthrobacter rhombi]|uniref:hypothetical protein n=1 Tax=Arthrobacter rhombi TaxID=71253 RepID=UPI003FD18361